MQREAIKDGDPNDLKGFVELLSKDANLANLCANNVLRYEGITSNANLFYHVYHFRAEGKRVYEVSDGLAWLLQNTNLDNTEVSLVRPPYPSIYVKIPLGLFTLLDARTGEHKIEGFYLRSYLKNDKRVFRIIATAVENDASSFALDDSYFFFWMEFDEHGKVKEELSRVMREEGKRWTVMLSDATQENAKKIPDFFRFVMNVILYSNSADVDCDWHPAWQKLFAQRQKARKERQKKRLRRELDALGNPRKLLGGKIVILREEKNAYREAHKTGRQVKVRFRVAGHWRSQPYGPKMSLRRPKWIKPYLKGPDAADVVNRVHRLGKD